MVLDLPPFCSLPSFYVLDRYSPRKAKVGDVRLPVRINQDVGRLEVTVDDLCVVCGE